MNTVLWIAQVLLATIFLAAGGPKRLLPRLDLRFTSSRSA